MFHPDYGSGATRVLLTMISRRARGKFVDIPAVADDLSRAKSTVYAHIQRLRRSGLVSDDRHARGSLRPLVIPVPFQREDEPCVICEDEFPRDHVACMRRWVETFERTAGRRAQQP